MDLKIKSNPFSSVLLKFDLKSAIIVCDSEQYFIQREQTYSEKSLWEGYFYEYWDTERSNWVMVELTRIKCYNLTAKNWIDNLSFDQSLIDQAKELSTQNSIIYWIVKKGDINSISISNFSDFYHWHKFYNLHEVKIIINKEMHVNYLGENLQLLSKHISIKLWADSFKFLLNISEEFWRQLIQFQKVSLDRLFLPLNLVSWNLLQLDSTSTFSSKVCVTLKDGLKTMSLKELLKEYSLLF